LGLLTEIGEGPIALDSSIFIYFIERNPLYLSVVKPIFQAIDEGRLEAVTSSLTLLETLVVPLRAGNSVVAHAYERFLTRGRGLRLVPLDFGLLRAAAHVRAAVRLKTPDALQVASALSAECPVFLTNDGRIPSMPGLRVLQLEDYPEP
jgi:predicted nucleic acid-binding protein